MGRQWSSRLECEMPRQCPWMVKKRMKKQTWHVMDVFLRHATGQHQWNAEAEKSILLFFQERQHIDQLCLFWPSDLSTDYSFTIKYQLLWETAYPLLEIIIALINQRTDISFQSLGKREKKIRQEQGKQSLRSHQNTEKCKRAETPFLMEQIHTSQTDSEWFLGPPSKEFYDKKSIIA